MNDIQSFALALGVIWAGLAAYLVWIDIRLRRLEKKNG